MKLAKLAVASVGIALTAGFVSAATFDFTGLTNATFPSPKVYASEGLSVTVSSSSPVSGAAIAEGISPSFYRGLGVVDSLDSFSSIDAGQELSFAIPAGYQVTSVTVARRGGAIQTAEFNLFNGPSLISSAFEVLETPNTAAIDGRETVSIAQGGSLFSISSADGNTGGIWVNEIVFEPLTDLTVVSLPPSIVILGSALGLGALLSWRRRSKS